MAADLRKRDSSGFDTPSERPVYSARSMAGEAGPGKNMGGMSTGLTISVTLLSALLVWGGIGYLIDRLAGTPKVFTAIGMLVGAAAGTYLIYLKHGRPDDPQDDNQDRA
jgi:F0F1-type ATP synthase assembly protein I